MAPDAAGIVASAGDAVTSTIDAASTGNIGAVTGSLVNGAGGIVGSTGLNSTGQMIAGVSDLASQNANNLAAGNWAGALTNSSNIVSQLAGGGNSTVTPQYAVTTVPQTVQTV